MGRSVHRISCAAWSIVSADTSGSVPKSRTCLFGITRVWPSTTGLSGTIAMTSDHSWTMVAGARPATISQNGQGGSVMCCSGCRVWAGGRLWRRGARGGAGGWGRTGGGGGRAAGRRRGRAGPRLRVRWRRGDGRCGRRRGRGSRLVLGGCDPAEPVSGADEDGRLGDDRGPAVEFGVVGGGGEEFGGGLAGQLLEDRRVGGEPLAVGHVLLLAGSGRASTVRAPGV